MTATMHHVMVAHPDLFIAMCCAAFVMSLLAFIGLLFECRPWRPGPGEPE